MRITPESVFGMVIFVLMTLMEIYALGQIGASIRQRSGGTALGLPMGLAMLAFAGSVQVMMAVEVIPSAHASPPTWIYYVAITAFAVIAGCIAIGGKRLLH